MKISTWLQKNYFSLGNKESSRKEIEILLSFVINKPISWIIGFSDNDLKYNQLLKLNHLIQRRLIGEPIAYIIGKCNFWSISLNISNKSFIPRIDSEIIVEETLSLIPNNKKIYILDLGCGSGALTLSLAYEKPTCFFLGVDYFHDLVTLSRNNAKNLNIINVKFIKSNWFSRLNNKKFDIIISNPPYIDINDKHLLSGDVRFEPLTSLVSKNQGLFDIQYISSQAHYFLKKRGWLIFEHGYNQAYYVQKILKKNNFVKIFTRKDYGNNDRVTGAMKE